MLPIVTYILSSLAEFLLWLFEWQPISDEFVDAFLRYPRKIVIFPHSTYWDFPLLAAYGMTKWQVYHGGVYAVMKPQLVNGYCGRFFKAFNCIAATPKHHSGGGFVEQTGLRFEHEPTFTILIAPDGTTKRAEWRSGYFYLAQRLNCPIQVMGIDYHNRCAVIKEMVIPTSLEETEQRLKEIMATIPTLHPEQSIVPSPRVKTSLYGTWNLFQCLFWFVLAIGAMYTPVTSVMLMAAILSYNAQP